MTWFVLASISALLSAAAAVAQKRVLFRMSALEFSFLVSLVILVCSMFVPFTVDVAAPSPSTLVIILGKSILGGTAFLLVMLALKNNQISNALPLLGVTPAVTALFSLLILGESLRAWEWTGVGLIVMGAYVLEKRQGQGILEPFRNALTPHSHRYILWAVGLFGISSVFDRMLVSSLKAQPLVVLFYQHAVYVLMFGMMLFVRRSSVAHVIREGRNQLPLIAVVAVLTVLYRLTQLEATKEAPVALVLAVKRTSILYASFFGGKLFSEDRLVMKLAGATVIVGAGFLILRNVA